MDTCWSDVPKLAWGLGYKWEEHPELQEREQSRAQRQDGGRGAGDGGRTGEFCSPGSSFLRNKNWEFPLHGDSGERCRRRVGK